MLTGLGLAGLHAQETEVEEDLKLWASGIIKIDVLKAVRVDVEQQFRFDNYISSFDQYFTEVAIRYKFNKFFNVKGQYRYQVTDKEHNEARIALDLNFEYDIKGWPVDIEYRLRLQDEKVEYTGQKKTYMRQRVGLDYNMSKLVDPYIEYESFFKFNDNMEFRANRYTLGLEWELNKRAELVTFGRIENEFNKKVPEHIMIVGLAYSYDLDLRKKKKKK